MENPIRLAYDPAGGTAFWRAVEALPGYPAGEREPIRRMLFESGALYRLSETLEAVGADRQAAVIAVMDSTPMRRGSDSLKPLLESVLLAAGWEVERVVVPPDATGQVHTDMNAIEHVKSRLRTGCSVVALGSGTICDITKHACFLFESQGGGRPPLVVYQTANSVSAFTSNMAPTFVDGVKRTLASRYPDALICDLETLGDAPPEMTAAGVGDLLAAFVSFPDWYLANRLGMDPAYSPLAQRLMGPMDALFLVHADAIRSGAPEGMALLAKLIALGGLAMSLSHATTPMSGYEHVISHVLDLIAELNGKPLAQHGAQAALATVPAAGAYRRFLADFDPGQVDLDRCYPDPGTMEARIRRTFAEIDPSGKAGEECWADYRVKLAAWAEHRDELVAFLDNWPQHRLAIQDLARPPEQALEILRAVGAPLTFAQLSPPASEADVRFAFLNAPLMRKRLTLGDLLIFMNWDRELLWREVWQLVAG